MKKMCVILAIVVLSPYTVSRADAEGPLHWTARHVSKAVVETGDTISNVARTAGRTIYHRTRPIREAVE
jgi:chromosome condensin MukBEF complex kleisin-like MukF subunit